MKPPHKPTPPSPVQSHPAYGHIYIDRQHGNARNLFGAVGPVHNTVAIEISQAEITERDNQEGGQLALPCRRLISVCLTELQFAQLFGTINGGGAACTIIQLIGNQIPPIPETTSPLEIISERFRAEMAKLGAECDTLIAEARELQAKPSVTKADRAKFTQIAEGMALKITNVQPYIAGKFTEATEEIRVQAHVDAHHDPVKVDLVAMCSVPGCDQTSVGNAPISINSEPKRSLPLCQQHMDVAEEDVPEGTIPAWLLTKTFAVQHNPNCPKAFLVRLPGTSAVIDYLDYDKTGDILGFGDTLDEAAKYARLYEVIEK
jgi:hypothetical protein